MISLTIGLIILAGMAVLFSRNSRTQAEIEKANRQVENGRYAVQLLSGDLRNLAFYGEFDPTPLPNPAALPALCETNLATLEDVLPLAVLGTDDAAAGAHACLPDLKANTDVLLIRRTETCLLGEETCADASAGGLLFQASLCNNSYELASGDTKDHYDFGVALASMTRHRRDCTSTAASGTLAPIRRLLVRIYYVANNDQAGDGIPTLKRAELTTAGATLTWNVVPLVSGVENLQLEYGMGAGSFNANPSTTGGCATPACAVQNWRNVEAVKVNVLARNLQPTAGHVDKTDYLLGRQASGADNLITAPNDAYKRHVFQAQVGLPNVAGRK
jgi:type IV pilus assembly protein PilW